MAGRPVKKILVVLLALVLAAALTAWWAWRDYGRFLAAPLDLPESGFLYEVRPGASGQQIVADLAAEGFTDAGWRWQLLMRLEPTVFHVGEYLLEAGLTPRQLLQRLSSSKVVQYRITLIEGWTFGQFAAAIAADGVLEHTIDLSAPYEWDPGTLFEGMQHPEGWFLPETYQFTRGDRDRDILERSHAAMQQALQSAWEARDTGLPLKSPYELLILASIIEKETALDEERERIAGVFVRRLQKGMRLQTDPTVIYGLGETFDGDIRRRDLKTDTPYNTYTRHGLPPTPIAMPGRASLEAAAHPAPGEELFFVADGKGGHTFSKTLAEHQAAVDKLLGRN